MCMRMRMRMRMLLCPFGYNVFQKNHISAFRKLYKYKLFPGKGSLNFEPTFILILFLYIASLALTNFDVRKKKCLEPTFSVQRFSYRV